MRANFAHGAVFAVVILALAGCHSGASSSGWSWNRKNASSTTQIASTPQLPSANATPSSYSPPAYTATTPAATRYPEQAAVPSGYQTTPYAEHPTGYVNSAYAAGSMPNAAAAGGNYSMPNAAPNGAAVPQTGPYNDVYAQARRAAVDTRLLTSRTIINRIHQPDRRPHRVNNRRRPHKAIRQRSILTPARRLGPPEAILRRTVIAVPRRSATIRTRHPVAIHTPHRDTKRLTAAMQITAILPTDTTPTRRSLSKQRQMSTQLRTWRPAIRARAFHSATSTAIKWETLATCPVRTATRRPASPRIKCQRSRTSSTLRAAIHTIVLAGPATTFRRAIRD